jgi:hypothetical protein
MSVYCNYTRSGEISGDLKTICKLKLGGVINKRLYICNNFTAIFHNPKYRWHYKQSNESMEYKPRPYIGELTRKELISVIV